MTDAELFVSTAQSQIKRPGIVELLTWLSTTDFYTAPASTRFHGAEPEGLVKHSLSVYARLLELVDWYKLEVDPESVAIVALFHDLCKVDSYKVAMRNSKNEKTGQWEKVPYYTRKEDYAFGGHGSKSVYLVMNFMKLLPEEAKKCIEAYLHTRELPKLQRIRAVRLGGYTMQSRAARWGQRLFG